MHEETWNRTIQIYCFHNICKDLNIQEYGLTMKTSTKVYTLWDIKTQRNNNNNNIIQEYGDWDKEWP